MSHEPGRERHMTHMCEKCGRPASTLTHHKVEDEYWCTSCIEAPVLVTEFGGERSLIARIIDPDLFERYDLEVKSGTVAQNGKSWAQVAYGVKIEAVLAKADAILAALAATPAVDWTPDPKAPWRCLICGSERSACTCLPRETPAVGSFVGVIVKRMNLLIETANKSNAWEAEAAAEMMKAVHLLTAKPTNDIATIRRYVKNARGAIESGQVVDKDVHGTLTKVIAMLDDLAAQPASPLRDLDIPITIDCYDPLTLREIIVAYFMADNQQYEGLGKRHADRYLAALASPCDELHDLGFNAGWNGAIEECVKLVENTGLRNQTNIARDIRALSASPLRGREALTKILERLDGPYISQLWDIRQIAEAAIASPPEQPDDK